VKTYEPTPYEEPSGAPSLSLIKVTETFVGDIQGEGSVSFIQAARADGSASFVALNGCAARSQDAPELPAPGQGTLVGKHVAGEWFVVPDSATGISQPSR